MTRWIALAALALVACAGEAPAPEVTTAPTLAPLTESSAATEESPAPCEVTFSPDAALLDAFTAAAERWSAATGCDIHIGEGGIRVRIVARDDADLFNAETGKYAPAVTVMADGETRISFSPDWESRASRAPMHEMGHALSRRSGAHSDDPNALMYWNPTQREITASDLTFVCAELACTLFQPEI